MNKIHRNVEVNDPGGLLRAVAGVRETPAAPRARVHRGSTLGPPRYVAMNFVHHLANFRRLVCGCMDSYDSEQSHILQHFSSSTR